MHSFMRSLGILLMMAACGMAGETAVLANGSRLRVERHETDGAVARLYTETGCIEISTAQVVNFELDGPTATAVAQSQPLTPSQPPVVSIQKTPEELADAAADKYGLPRKLVRSVMAAESAFQPGA